MLEQRPQASQNADIPLASALNASTFYPFLIGRELELELIQIGAALNMAFEKGYGELTQVQLAHGKMLRSSLLRDLKTIAKVCIEETNLAAPAKYVLRVHREIPITTIGNARQDLDLRGVSELLEQEGRLGRIQEVLSDDAEVRSWVSTEASRIAKVISPLLERTQDEFYKGKLLLGLKVIWQRMCEPIAAGLFTVEQLQHEVRNSEKTVYNCALVANFHCAESLFAAVKKEIGFDETFESPGKFQRVFSSLELKPYRLKGLPFDYYVGAITTIQNEARARARGQDPTGDVEGLKEAVLKSGALRRLPEASDYDPVLPPVSLVVKLSDGISFLYDHVHLSAGLYLDVNTSSSLSWDAQSYSFAITAPKRVLFSVNQKPYAGFNAPFVELEDQEAAELFCGIEKRFRKLVEQIWLRHPEAFSSIGTGTALAIEVSEEGYRIAGGPSLSRVDCGECQPLAETDAAAILHRFGIPRQEEVLGIEHLDSPASETGKEISTPIPQRFVGSDKVRAYEKDGFSPLQAWLLTLDKPLRLQLEAKLEQIALSKVVGDWKLLNNDHGTPLFEFRRRSGHRIYYCYWADTMWLLGGGNKATQNDDIRHAGLAVQDLVSRFPHGERAVAHH